MKKPLRRGVLALTLLLAVTTAVACASAPNGTSSEEETGSIASPIPTNGQVCTPCRRDTTSSTGGSRTCRFGNGEIEVIECVPPNPPPPPPTPSPLSCTTTGTGAACYKVCCTQIGASRKQCGATRC